MSVVRFRPWPYPLQTIRVGHRVWNIVLNAERQGVLRSSYPDLRCLASSRPDLAAVVVKCGCEFRGEFSETPVDLLAPSA